MRIHVTANEVTYYGMAMSVKRICEVIMRNEKSILPVSHMIHGVYEMCIRDRYKNADNVIAETDAEGHQKARFIPVPAFQTAEAMDELCRQFLDCLLYTSRCV